jgi:peptide deformylase
MIITNDEAALRVKCEEVTPAEVSDLITVLEQELNYANKLGKGGIGLAAPQIGIAKNIAIVRLAQMSFNLVNCKIQQGYDPATFVDEGCLSFPGRLETTTRFQEIHIVNNLVYPHTFVATGLVAVVCQHEMDHLNSTLFMDRAQPKPVIVEMGNKVGPNKPCPCNSGKKYKKCCGK